MSNLWTTADGQAATREAVNQIIRERLSRHFERNFVVEFNAWIESGKTVFDFLNVIGNMNDGNDQEILDLYQLLLALGDLPVTVADLDIYVNNVTGSDSVGLGTASAPFATVGKALDVIKNTWIDHTVHILIAHTAGVNQTVYNDDVWFINNKIRKGTLAIIGVGIPLQTKAATTIQSVTDLGDGAHVINQTDLGWTVNDWISEFVLGPNGADDELYAYAVHKNDANNIWLHAYSDLPVALDEITGIKPAISVRLENITIEPSVLDTTSASFNYSKFAIVNLDLDCTLSDSPDTIFSVSNYEIWLDFVSMRFRNGGSFESVLQNCSINYLGPVDQTLQTASESGIKNLGDRLGSPGWSLSRKTKGLQNSEIMSCTNSNVANATCAGKIWINKGVNELYTCSAISYLAVRGDHIQSTSCFFSSDAAKDACTHWQMTFQIVGCYIAESRSAVVARSADGEIWDETECDPLSRTALECFGGCRVKITGAMAGFQGVSNLKFSAVSPFVLSVFPAVNASINDGMLTSPSDIVFRA